MFLFTFLTGLLEKLKFAPSFHAWFSVFLLPCVALNSDQLDFQLPLRIAAFNGLSLGSAFKILLIPETHWTLLQFMLFWNLFRILKFWILSLTSKEWICSISHFIELHWSYFFFFFFKFKVCGNLTWSKSDQCSFPAVLAHFMSLGHSLVILTIFQTFSLLLCML